MAKATKRKKSALRDYDYIKTSNPGHYHDIETHRKILLKTLDHMQKAVRIGLVDGPAEVGILAAKLREIAIDENFEPLCDGDQEGSDDLFFYGLCGDVIDDELEEYLNLDRTVCKNR